ncbi:MAG: HD domain-containing protein [Ruminococcus sp.]|nr:HD domain-containing protein [Ruminococcus sp.]
MNSKIIKFYIAANNLKNIIRTGWKELEVSSERLESVAEHIYGCLVLAIALDSEHNLNLDMLKVFKMLIVKELEKIDLKENSTRDYESKEERASKALAKITELTDGLVKQEEIVELVKEYNSNSSKEAKFVFQLSKIEADFQAKLYDINNNMELEVAKEDAKYFGEELANEIIPKMQNASDGFILYDRKLYSDELFKDLSKAIQELN